MLRILTILFLNISIQQVAFSSSLDRIRVLYKHAVSNKDSCDKLIKVLDEYNPENNLLLAGYKGCAKMIMAKYVLNPISKYSYFSEGKTMLEKCIKNDKFNLELRFLRFSIQTNLPGFLGYKDSINADKTFLMESVKSLKDLKLRTIVIKYLKNSSMLSSNDKRELR